MPNQPGKKKKRRAGKKEQEKRERRRERELLEPNPPPFELRETGTKGLGLFALQDISFGERVIEEKPLFLIPRVGTRVELTNDAIIVGFQNLPRDEQADFLALCNHTTYDESLATETNAKSPSDPGSAQTPSGQKSYSAEQDDQHNGECGEFDNTVAVESDCKMPKQAVGSDDHIPSQHVKLEPAEYEDKTSDSLADESNGVRPPSSDGNQKATRWHFRDMDDVLEAMEAELKSVRSTTPSSESSDNAKHERHVDEYEMTMELATRIIRIWETNAIALDDGLGSDWIGIGIQTSRLNHSCRPNVHVAENNNGFITVQAIRPIKAGEELLYSYIFGAGKLRDERRAELRKWGFECACVACDGEDDEPRRKRMKLLIDKLDVFKLKWNESVPVSVASEEVDAAQHDSLELGLLMQQEGLMGPDLGEV